MLVVGFMFFLGCRGPFDEPPCSDPWNPDCVNYDPCLSQDTAWAEFDILKELYWFVDKRQFHYQPVTDDTLFLWPNAHMDRVWFRARADYPQRYYWKVGTDPRVFTDSAFFLWFASEFIGPYGTIDVRLVACLDSIDRTCFPRARLCDTVTHSFFYLDTYIDREPWYPTGGKFDCTFVDMPEDTFCLTVQPEGGDIGTIPPPYLDYCDLTEIILPVGGFVGPKKIEIPPSPLRVRGYGIIREHPRRLVFELDIRPLLDTTDQNWVHRRIVCWRKR